MNKFGCRVASSALFLMFSLTNTLAVLPVFANNELSHSAKSFNDCDPTAPKTFDDQHYKASGTVQAGWLSVPIFFVTDRDGSCNCFSQNQISYTSTEKLAYGLKNITAPLTVHLRDDVPIETFKAMGWPVFRGLHRPSEEILNSFPYPYKNEHYKSSSEFFASLQNYRKVTGFDQKPNQGEVVVVIAGCCQPFNFHMDNAGFLATWIKSPIISYDWTAPKVQFGELFAQIKNYRKNEILAQRSQDRFNQFLDQLEQEIGPDKVVLIAHSMGNRLLEQALIRRSLKNPNRGKFKDVIFACADTDAVAFAEHADKILDQTKKLIILMSTKDHLLQASQLLHGEYSRLGSADNTARKQLATMKDALPNSVVIVDATAANIDHSLPLWIVSSFHKTGAPPINSIYDTNVASDGVITLTVNPNKVRVNSSPVK